PRPSLTHRLARCQGQRRIATRQKIHWLLSPGTAFAPRKIHRPFTYRSYYVRQRISTIRPPDPTHGEKFAWPGALRCPRADRLTPLRGCHVEIVPFGQDIQADV